MTKSASTSALVKIGVPSEQAEGMRQMRRVRQILDQHDAALARLDAATRDRIREALMMVDPATDDAPLPEAVNG